jgi:hypothetical protein
MTATQLNAILYPGFALGLLTLLAVLRLGLLRYGAVGRREVDPRYYSLYVGEGEPERLRVWTRHVLNLFEAPILFYAVLAFARAAEVGSRAMVVFAWTYVGLRLIHSFIHLGSNNVRHRFFAYGASMLVLTALWVATAWAVLSASLT